VLPGYAGPFLSRSTTRAVPAAAANPSGATAPRIPSSLDQMDSAGTGDLPTEEGKRRDRTRPCRLLQGARRSTDTLDVMEAAFFDLDKTVIARSSTLAFSKPLYRAGFLGRRAVMRMGLAQLFYLLFGADEDQLTRARDELLHLIEGWQRADVESLVVETLDEVADPMVYAEALFLIDEHARQGREVYIVSASPEEIVRPIARHIGVTNVIATRVKTDAQGRYVAEIDVYAMGPGKAEAMRALAERTGIDLANSYAYSDSVTDLPMLEAVGNPVAVNPDKDLRREAEEREWPILEFQRPVSLGPAIPRPSPFAGIAVAASAVALGAAVILLKRRARQG